MPTRRQTLLAAALPLLAAPALPGTDGAPPKKKELALVGEVLPLAELLKAEKIDLEPDAAEALFALKDDAGEALLLLKNGGSLALFRDPALRRRPLRVHGRLVFGLLHVRQFFVLKDGKPFAVHYWCDVCAIKRFALDAARVCECCGGPMERKETPADP